MTPTTHLQNIVYLKNLIAMHVPKSTFEAMKGGSTNSSSTQMPLTSDTSELSRVRSLSVKNVALNLWRNAMKHNNHIYLKYEIRNVTLAGLILSSTILMSGLSFASEVKDSTQIGFGAGGGEDLGPINYEEVVTYPEWEDIQNKPYTATRWPQWGEVTGKPSLFPTDWSMVDNIPTEFPAEEHHHDALYLKKTGGKLSGNIEMTDSLLLFGTDNSPRNRPIHIVGDNFGGYNPAIAIEKYIDPAESDPDWSGALIFYHATGNIDEPKRPIAGRIGNVSGRVYDEEKDSHIDASTMYFSIPEDWEEGEKVSSIDFYTTQNHTESRRNSMMITDGGHVNINKTLRVGSIDPEETGGDIQLGFGLRGSGQSHRAQMALLSKSNAPTDIILGNGDPTDGTVNERAKWGISSRGDDNDNEFRVYSAPSYSRTGNWLAHLRINHDGRVGMASAQSEKAILTVHKGWEDSEYSIKAGNGLYLGGTGNANIAPDIYMDNVGVVASDTELFLNSANGRVTFGDALTRADANRMARIINGEMYASGYNTTSDARLKDNITDLSNSLDNITLLRGVNYLWKDESEEIEQVGLIAQEVAKVYPHIVHEDEETGYLSVNYDGLIAPLIESVKKLNADKTSLEDKVAKLENKIKNLTLKANSKNKVVSDLQGRLTAIEEALDIK